MKKIALIAVLFAAFGTANATVFGDTVNNNQTYNQPQGGQGGAGGNGGDASAIAGASSAAEAKAAAAAIAAQAQKQKQEQEQNQQQTAKATGGSAKATGGTGNGVVDVRYAGAERSAPGVFAAPIPTVTGSCRLYMFGGGTNVNGAVSGSIPLGNDQTCLSGVNLKNMAVINQYFPDTFGKKSMVDMACKTEGMSEVAECKAK